MSLVVSVKYPVGARKQPRARLPEAVVGSLTRALALPARQASGMRLGGLRAPTRIDAPTEP
ncbi:MAG: hypothetical protein J07HQX50_00942, partial [Haloquadratum sp. J07HQX50]